MTKLTIIDRATANVLLQRITAAVKDGAFKAIADDLGLEFNVAAGSYSEVGLTVKLEAKIAGKVSSIVVQLAAMHGIDANKVGPNGERLENYGRGSKRPWKVRTADGKLYNYPEALAKKTFPLDAPAKATQAS